MEDPFENDIAQAIRIAQRPQLKARLAAIRVPRVKTPAEVDLQLGRLLEHYREKHHQYHVLMEDTTGEELEYYLQFSWLYHYRIRRTIQLRGLTLFSRIPNRLRP